MDDIVEQLREDARGGKAYHELSDMAADEIERLRAGIQAYLDGEYGYQFKGSKLLKCPHGQFRHETCEGCIDEHFTELLINPAK